jgi:hypothetical protein
MHHCGSGVRLVEEVSNMALQVEPGMPVLTWAASVYWRLQPPFQPECSSTYIDAVLNLSMSLMSPSPFTDGQHSAGRP